MEMETMTVATEVLCPFCKKTTVRKEGKRLGVQHYRCNACKKFFSEKTKVAEAKQLSVGVVSLDIIKEKFDFKKKILGEISTLEDSLISEAALCERILGADRNRFRRVLDNNEAVFKEYRIHLKFPGEKDAKWYWGRKEVIHKVDLLQRLG